jgi:hypothetical protein
MGIWTNLFAQKSSTKFSNYKDSEQKYSIDYPESWNVEKNKDGVISIESEKIKGGIYISAHEGITFPDQHMADFILESNNLPVDFKENILNGEENGIKSWYISYTDTNNHLTCMSMYKRKGDKLWFVSTEIEPTLWKNGWQEIIIKILTSFKIDAI